MQECRLTNVLQALVFSKLFQHLEMARQVCFFFFFVLGNFDMLCNYYVWVWEFSCKVADVKCKYLGKLMDKLTEEAFDQCNKSYHA